MNLHRHVSGHWSGCLLCHLQRVDRNIRHIDDMDRAWSQLELFGCTFPRMLLNGHRCSVSSSSSNSLSRTIFCRFSSALAARSACWIGVPLLKLKSCIHCDNPHVRLTCTRFLVNVLTKSSMKVHSLPVSVVSSVSSELWP